MSEFTRVRRLNQFFTSRNPQRRVRSLLSYLETSSEVEQMSFYKNHHVDIYNTFLDAVQAYDERRKVLSEAELLSMIGILIRLLRFSPHTIRSGWENQTIFHSIRCVMKSSNRIKIRTAGLEALLHYIDCCEIFKEQEFSLLISIFQPYVPNKAAEPDYTGCLTLERREDHVPVEEAAILFDFLMRFVETRQLKRFKFWWTALLALWQELFPFSFSSPTAGEVYDWLRAKHDCVCAPLVSICCDYIIRWADKDFTAAILASNPTPTYLMSELFYYYSGFGDSDEIFLFLTKLEPHIFILRIVLRFFDRRLFVSNCVEFLRSYRQDPAFCHSSSLLFIALEFVDSAIRNELPETARVMYETVSYLTQCNDGHIPLIEEEKADQSQARADAIDAIVRGEDDIYGLGRTKRKLCPRLLYDENQPWFKSSDQAMSRFGESAERYVHSFHACHAITASLLYLLDIIRYRATSSRSGKVIPTLVAPGTPQRQPQTVDSPSEPSKAKFEDSDTEECDVEAEDAEFGPIYLLMSKYYSRFLLQLGLDFSLPLAPPMTDKRNVGGIAIEGEASAALSGMIDADQEWMNTIIHILVSSLQNCSSVKDETTHMLIMDTFERIIKCFESVNGTRTVVKMIGSALAQELGLVPGERSTCAAAQAKAIRIFNRMFLSMPNPPKLFFTANIAALEPAAFHTSVTLAALDSLDTLFNRGIDGALLLVPSIIEAALWLAGAVEPSERNISIIFTALNTVILYPFLLGETSVLACSGGARASYLRLGTFSSRLLDFYTGAMSKLPAAALEPVLQGLSMFSIIGEDKAVLTMLDLLRDNSQAVVNYLFEAKASPATAVKVIDFLADFLHEQYDARTQFATRKKMSAETAAIDLLIQELEKLLDTWIRRPSSIILENHPSVLRKVLQIEALQTFGVKPALKLACAPPTNFFERVVSTTPLTFEFDCATNKGLLKLSAKLVDNLPPKRELPDYAHPFPTATEPVEPDTTEHVDGKLSSLLPPVVGTPAEMEPVKEPAGFIHVIELLRDQAVAVEKYQ